MSISSYEMRREISRLNGLDLRIASYDYIESTYNRLMNNMIMTVDFTNKKQVFFRVRKMGNRPALVSEVGAPPSNLVTGFQRCNSPGRPMFYVSSSRTGAMVESKVRKGDIFYLSQWMCKEEIPVCRIFHHDETENHASIDVLLSHIDTIFRKRVHETFSSDYMLTSAVSARLMSKVLSDFGDGERVVYAGNALRYPSVLDFGRTYNTCVESAVARQSFQIMHIMEVEALKMSDEYVEIKITDTSDIFEDDKIIWSQNPTRLPDLESEESSRSYYFDGKSWRIRLNSNEISQSYMARLMELSLQP